MHMHARASRRAGHPHKTSQHNDLEENGKIRSCTSYNIYTVHFTPGWLGSRVVSVLDSGSEGLGSNRSRDVVGEQS